MYCSPSPLHSGSPGGVHVGLWVRVLLGALYRHSASAPLASFSGGHTRMGIEQAMAFKSPKNFFRRNT